MGSPIGLQRVVLSSWQQTSLTSTSVLIIGAGAAGLAAGQALAAAGIPSVILEARDRLGGRIHTRYDFAATPVEEGAEFIHGEGAVLHSLAQQHGIQPWPIDRYQHLWWGQPGQAAQPRQDLPVPLAQTLAGLLKIWDQLGVDPIQPDLSLADFVLKQGWDPAVLEMADTLLAQPCCSTLADLSCQDWIRENRMDRSGKQEFRLPQGYGHLLQHYAQGLDIRLNTPVDQIDWEHSLAGSPRVKVWSGSRCFTAAACIVTVPVAILQTGSLRFYPPLSLAKQSAIAAFRVDPATKLIYRFAPPAPWPDPQMMIAHLGLTARWWIPQPQQDPVIISFISADRARQIDALPASEALDLGLQELGSLLGKSFPDLKAQCQAAERISWGQDPYALGGYAHLPPGQADARVDLARPEAGILFFAGEATAHTSNPQTVHGAIESGWRAAQECRVLGGVNLPTTNKGLKPLV